ncbi:MAG: radical SAM protein [Deltaproteobacteria bacterium]|nr:radical SAM protein [Deltaproteobacteria bacterium]
MVAEIFASIQGESTAMGLPCAFVRLAGCDLACTWCDTAWARSGGTPMVLSAVLEAVEALGLRLVEVTGGEPLLQEACLDLLSQLLARGHAVLLETSGSRDLTPVPSGVRVIMDLKPPSSGEEGRNLWSNLTRLKPTDEVKIVLADRADYAWARDVLERHDLVRRAEVLFSPVEGRLPASELAAWILADRLPVRLQIQLHKVLWGPLARGR